MVNSKDSVELVVNCYQRTWEFVLGDDFMARLEENHQRSFARRVVVVSNVDEPERVHDRARELREAGRIDDFTVVSEHVEEARRVTGLSARDLGRIHYYSDFALVAVTRCACPWIVVWDAEAELVEPGDWVTAAIELMETDERILVANPSWEDGGLERETAEGAGDFALGYGFSDQVFLARAAELARPIYEERCLASLRYPTSHIAATFEQRVDSYLRTQRRLRATHRSIRYRHPFRGTDAYRPRGLAERFRRARHRRIVRSLARDRSDDPCRRIDWSADS